MATTVYDVEVSFTKQTEFSRGVPPRRVTFHPPADHPGMLLLLEWHREKLLADARAEAPLGSGDLG